MFKKSVLFYFQCQTVILDICKNSSYEYFARILLNLDFGSFSPRRGFRRRDIESEYFQIIIQIIFWESVWFNLWDFSRMDIFNHFQDWSREYTYIQY